MLSLVKPCALSCLFVGQSQRVHESVCGQTRSRSGPCTAPGEALNAGVVKDRGQDLFCELGLTREHEGITCGRPPDVARVLVARKDVPQLDEEGKRAGQLPSSPDRSRQRGTAPHSPLLQSSRPSDSEEERLEREWAVARDRSRVPASWTTGRAQGRRAAVAAGRRSTCPRAVLTTELETGPRAVMCNMWRRSGKRRSRMQTERDRSPSASGALGWTQGRAQRGRVDTATDGRSRVMSGMTLDERSGSGREIGSRGVGRGGPAPTPCWTSGAGFAARQPSPVLHRSSRHHPVSSTFQTAGRNRPSQASGLPE